ncbi:SGNH/GDSL hydrolase family protein [Mesorhizobium sp. M7A.F.Ca.MR.362.00.0.0]|uniref:SGNH/GDSL hydrolase family protein n=1 Tax=Mesorhizobium sp. M7A.F.Ca.MR.362.00.0.0 TaxID=2496779 RepID=UPI000FD40019|nr:SGNH/GDSL hydrolase family protein [Mesorhizobium sp. M7A.F.Ca.MR.362.00.0.0]RUU75102.1 SGNH/GDSL hydrolase family protein [Mesorhizobium sp. M7A.F.Ca.MR.362.00.0.0]RWN95434.1 MAG: SGNH/GDSL hydrolase family protein [Mesorhizobium sp.]
MMRFGLGLRLGHALAAAGGPPVVLPSLYLGQVATRCRIPTNLSTTNKLANARTMHIARDDLTSIKIELPAWFWYRTSTKAEVNVTGNIVYRASIEYPAGTFTQVTFASGAVSGTATGIAPLLSDWVNVNIPKGAKFWVRSYAVATHSIVFADASSGTNFWTCDFANGEAYEYGASGITDKTMGGTLVPNKTDNTAAICHPTAIIGMTRNPSVLLIGDSRVAGFGDFFNAAGDTGELARSIGPSLAYINAGSSGDTLSEFIASHTRRAALQSYCSHVVVETAINALRSGTGQNKTAATVLAEQQTILGYFPTKRCYTTTTSPSATSNNSWATSAGQTVNTNLAQISAYNDAIRAGVANSLGFFEIADQVEIARNSGKWKSDGTAAKWTADGLHGTPFAYQAIQDSGAVDPTRFSRAGL